MRLKAYAKINLALRILGRRPDGYHELDSLMQSVSLHDVVTLTEIPSGLEVAATNLKLPTDGRNLAYRAAELFLRGKGQGSRGKGVKIFIEKNIPLAAGLAGGSADAAAVLYGLNRMLNPAGGLRQEELMALGAEIGSDVPFCLRGGNCRVTGRGEHVRRNPLHAVRAYVLVVPDVEVSTKWAYEAYDQMTNAELRMPNEGRRNDLEFAGIRRYPVIQKVKEKLVELGCSYAQMSGSGPSVFGIAAEGERVLSAIKKEYLRSFLLRSVERGVEELRH